MGGGSDAAVDVTYCMDLVLADWPFAARAVTQAASMGCDCGDWALIRQILIVDRLDGEGRRSDRVLRKADKQRARRKQRKTTRKRARV